PFHLETSPNRTTTPIAAAPTIERIRTRTGVAKPLTPAAVLSSRDRSLARSISAVLPDSFEIVTDNGPDQDPAPADTLPAVVVPAVVEPPQVVPAEVVPAEVVPPEV